MADFGALLNWWRNIIPVGEYPDLPAGVEPAATPARAGSTGRPDVDTIAGILARHQHRVETDPAKARRGLRIICGCGQGFEFIAGHVRHVAELICDEESIGR